MYSSIHIFKLFVNTIIRVLKVLIIAVVYILLLFVRLFLFAQLFITQSLQTYLYIPTIDYEYLQHYDKIAPENL